LDAGASHHMFLNSSSFASMSHLFSIPVMIADGTLMPVACVGSVITPHLSLPNIYHILKLTLNLASVGQLCDNGNLVTFSSSSCYVQDLQSEKLIGTGRRKGGLYIFDELKVSVVVAATSVDLSSFRLSPSFSFYLWHSRLSHVSSSRLRYLASTGALGNLQPYDCSGCKLENFQLYLLIEIFLFLPLHLILFILMYGGLHLLPQKESLDIIFLLLMIIHVIVGFI